MKYYAVTEDPRELYHYGVKGMKWGQHIFGDKPKSPGYHKAVKKLKAAKASTVSKSSEKQIKVAQKDYNRRAKQEAKYLKAVQKAQFKNSMVEALHNFDKEDSYRKALVREQKAAKINEKLANVRADRELHNLGKSIKSEKKFDKYMQQAREGSLHYGNLSEDQIRKVQERLNLEDQTRRLGGKEKPSWREQKKEARRAGKLQGITRATAAVSEEVARGVAQFGIQGLSNRIMMKSAAKHEGQYERVMNKAKNKKTVSDIRKETRDKIRQEVYENDVREGTNMFGRLDSVVNTTAGRARLLKQQNERKELKQEQKNLENERRQLNNRLYEKALTGSKNREQSKAFIENLKNREKIYGLIYEPNSSNRKKQIDQLFTNSNNKPKKYTIAKTTPRIKTGRHVRGN